MARVMAIGCGLVALTMLGCVGREPRIGVDQNDIDSAAGNDDIVDIGGSAVNDLQRFRDATVRVSLGNNECTGTLVSPRVVLTSAHCMGNTGAVPTPLVEFGPENGSGPGYTGAVIIPARHAIAVIDCVADSTAGLVGDGCAQACPRLGGGGAGAYCLDGGSWGHDIAFLILAERLDIGPSGQRPSSYSVVPAVLDEEEPGGDDPFAGTAATLVGYGLRGLSGLDNSRDQLRQWASVGITGCAGGGTTCLFIDGVGRPGDSGGPVFRGHYDQIPDNAPRRLLGVFGYGGDQYVRISHSDIRTFVERAVGARAAHYPGALVPVDARGSTRTGPAAPPVMVWTGGVDLPPRTEQGERLSWGLTHRCPAGVTCSDPERCTLCGDPELLDPDGDGLVLTHDNCWGVYNPLQQVGDPSRPSVVDDATRMFMPPSSAFDPSTASQSVWCTLAGVAGLSCLPRTAATIEPSIDADHDQVPDPCDNCDRYNPHQDLCNGRAAACLPDADADGLPDECDACPADASTSTRDCNVDAELAIQRAEAMAMSRPCFFSGECGLDRTCAGGGPTGGGHCVRRGCTVDTECTAPHVCDHGVCATIVRPDVCDPTPCGFTTIESERQTRFMAGATRDFLVQDRVLTDATRSRALAPEDFRSGFRFCPCSAGTSDTSAAIDACIAPRADLSGGCVVPTSASVTRLLYREAQPEQAPYLGVTLEGDSRLDSRSQITLTHQFDPAVELDARWRIGDDLTMRWLTHAPSSFPAGVFGPVPTGGEAQVRGVVWTQTLRRGVAGPDLAAEQLPLAAHYSAGPIGGAMPAVRLGRFDLAVPLPGIPDLCPNCGDRLPVPWMEFPCPPAPDRPCGGSGPSTPAIAIHDVTLGADLSVALAPSLALFGGLTGVRWLAAAEPAARIGDGGLRFAALGADGGLAARLLTANGAELAPFGKLACNKAGCNQVSIPAAAFASPVTVSAATAPKATRTGYAMAMSGRDAMIYIAGGVDGDGNDLHDVVAYSAIGQVAQTIPTAPLTLGRVQALAWSTSEQRLFAIDELQEGRRWITRLVSIAPDWSGAREEARWPASHDGREDRRRAGPDASSFALAIDPAGHVWVAVSRIGGRTHTVLRLTRRAARDRRGGEDRCHHGPRGDESDWVLDGVLTQRGVVHVDGAYASDEGLSLAIALGTEPRVVGYAPSDLGSRRGLDLWL